MENVCSCRNMNWQDKGDALLSDFEFPRIKVGNFCDLQIKFKVSQMNIFQETKKWWIIIISWSQIYRKIPQTAPNFTEKINNMPVYSLSSSQNQIFQVHQHGSALDLLQINYSSSWPKLQLTHHFFTNHYWKVNSNPGWIGKYKSALSKSDSSWDNSYWGY